MWALHHSATALVHVSITSLTSCSVHYDMTQLDAFHIAFDGKCILFTRSHYTVSAFLVSTSLE